MKDSTNTRTPITDALTVLCRLTDYFNKLAEDRDEQPFMEELIKAASAEKIDCDLIIEEMEKECGKGQYNAPYALILACAYAVQAMGAYRSENPEDRQQAWPLAADAWYCFGIVTGTKDKDINHWDVMSRKNRANAQLSRPKKALTNRFLTIEEMCRWREKDHTFGEFMGAAQNETIDGLSLCLAESPSDRVFKIFWGDLKEEEKSEKTLIDWWTDSGKKLKQK